MGNSERLTPNASFIFSFFPVLYIKPATQYQAYQENNEGGCFYQVWIEIYAGKL